MPRWRPKHQTFFIQSLENSIKFQAYFGDGAPLVIDGYGGWSVTGRPKGMGLTEWQGRNPIAVEIPFVIDNYTVHQRIQNDEDETPNEKTRCDNTEDMVHILGNLAGVGEGDQPPILKVDGYGVIPHDDTNDKSSDHQWVIESITWDRDIEIRSGRYGKRLRCGGMIVIRMFKTSTELLRRMGPNTRARKPEIYIVRKGDTLQKIAVVKYKNAGKWKIIADANNIRDPRSLKQGQKLRIPR